MPSDPRLVAALDLARRLSALRAAEDWTLETVQASEDANEAGEFFVTLTLRWTEGAPESEEELRREIL